ncbi:MAG: hypothetical protein HYR72_14960 [Deltaproteobacteria bacterium]|nr:hypothetical protein [Deltaproteobacteria bacterium]MBI3390906.1 hypothetical protein [Deltaproteobacteria bacterium]
MLQSLVPNKQKIAGAAIVLAAIWLSQSINTYVFGTFLMPPDSIESFTRIFADNPEAMEKFAKAITSMMSANKYLMALAPVVQWVVRVAFAYLAACIIIATATPKGEPPTNAV